MLNEIRTIYDREFSEGFDSRFFVGSWVWMEPFEKGRRTYCPKCYEYDNEDEEKSPNILNDKNVYLVSRLFANGPGDQSSIPGHTKDSKNRIWCLLT